MGTNEWRDTVEIRKREFTPRDKGYLLTLP